MSQWFYNYYCIKEMDWLGEWRPRLFYYTVPWSLSLILLQRDFVSNNEKYNLDCKRLDGAL